MSRSTISVTNTRKILQEILRGELDFHDASSSYASHSLHAFAAKFPPQLPRTFIQYLTEPGDVVLDPMMGSGTAILEAGLLGRRAIGVDIDPLAVLLTAVKSTPLQAGLIRQAGEAVTARALALIQQKAPLREEIRRRFDAPTLDFIDYWFLSETQEELIALLIAIEQQKEPRVLDFLRLLFSSVIITKSGGVSLALDLAHSRPHRVITKKPRSPIKEFETRMRKALAALEDLPLKFPKIEIHRADARRLPLPSSSVDLVITSPPYANAIDYVRAHKFSLVWFGQSIASLSQLRSAYIGAENCRQVPKEPLPVHAQAALQSLASLDAGKARVLRKYLIDMKRVLGEILRVLRPNCAAGIVVGPSTMRGIRIETHEHLAEIALELGFDVVGICERKLDRDRRMMPARRKNAILNGIEQRMHEEFVIGLTKP